LRVGRDASCEVRIDDESVSRVHFVVQPGTPPVVVDRGSRNGTFVGPERLAPRASKPLAAGTLIRAGRALLLVDHEPDKSDAPTMEPSRLGPMAKVMETADKVARDDITVLLTGETGVGKEVLARYIHERSARNRGPFVPVHAAALSAALFESELFGHEKGAFTGADADRAGLFEVAHGGTIFFDEIGELPLDMQPKLLRVLEDRRVVRVGGREATTVDVRILAATNRDLAADAASGAFRSDLYFRLGAFPLRIPPLRERTEEIADLARGLLARAAAERNVDAVFSDDAIDRMRAHAWPGNVRELGSVVLRALLLSDSGKRTLDAADVASAIADASPAAARADDERVRIVAALERHAGNQSAAAAELGMARRTLLYKLDKLGIPRPRKRSKT
jgi:DNA-binding NtrC family response regulator